MLIYFTAEYIWKISVYNLISLKFVLPKFYFSMYIRDCVLRFLKTHSKDAIKAVIHVAEWTPFPALTWQCAQQGACPQALLLTPPTVPPARTAPNLQPTRGPWGVACPDPAEAPPEAPLDKLPLFRQDSSRRAKDICHVNPWPSPKSSDAPAHGQHGANVSTTRTQNCHQNNVSKTGSPTLKLSSPRH